MKAKTAERAEETYRDKGWRGKKRGALDKVGGAAESINTSTPKGTGKDIMKGKVINVCKAYLEGNKIRMRY